MVYHLTKEEIRLQSLTNEMIYQKLDTAFGKFNGILQCSRRQG